MSSGFEKKAKILFVNDQPLGQITTFIEQDMLALEKYFSLEYLTLEKYGHDRMDCLFSSSVWKAVKRSDLVFIWFGNNSAVGIIAKILKKPVIIVGGGADVTFVPQIGYGLRRSDKIQLYLRAIGFKSADKVLLFSESSLRDFLTLPGANTHKGRAVYLSVDTNKFKPNGEKKFQALTVGYINESNMRRKGLQTFIDAACLTPEIKFRLIGQILEQKTADKIKANAPANLDFFGYTDNNELLKRHIPFEYQQSLVYAQLSYHEGFGVALAEAMACGCIPIITACGAMPEVAADIGFCVPVDDPQAASVAIRKAINSNNKEQSLRARERIVNLFPAEKREATLKSIIEELLK